MLLLEKALAANVFTDKDNLCLLDNIIHIFKIVWKFVIFSELQKYTMRPSGRLEILRDILQRMTFIGTQLDDILENITILQLVNPMVITPSEVVWYSVIWIALNGMT